MKVDTESYFKFLNSKISLEEGEYTRAELLALATNMMDAKLNDLHRIFPTLGIKLKKKEAADEMIAQDKEIVKAVEESVAPPEKKETKKITSDSVVKAIQWIIKDPKRKAALEGCLVGKSGPKDLGFVVGHMPVGNVTRWLFTAIQSDVTNSSIKSAIEGDNSSLLSCLFDIGLDEEGIFKHDQDNAETVLWKKAKSHQFAWSIINGWRTPDEMKMTNGSAAAYMKALKTLIAMTQQSKSGERMAGHLRDKWNVNGEESFAASVKPLVNGFAKINMADEGDLVIESLKRGYVNHQLIAELFTVGLDSSRWQDLYSSLKLILPTIGPVPPWISSRGSAEDV